ncbi:MAG: hypothetical protein DME43_09870 [Verrucomicrobia bacterium]|nr:MAG: hypothetical protein DME43_09870 [Verrucomicrobiota bacterium]
MSEPASVADHLHESSFRRDTENNTRALLGGRSDRVQYFWGAQATSLLAAAACRGSSAYIIRNNENDCFRQAAGKLRAGSPRSPDRRIRGTRSMTLYATHA